MKIGMSLGVSQETGYRKIDLEDLDYTEDSWNKLSEEQKRDVLEDYINDLPEHPYWVLDTFNEEE